MHLEVVCIWSPTASRCLGKTLVAPARCGPPELLAEREVAELSHELAIPRITRLLCEGRLVVDVDSAPLSSLDRHVLARSLHRTLYESLGLAQSPIPVTIDLAERRLDRDVGEALDLQPVLLHVVS